ncbi:MucBP domain-containing protein, partial [Listeria booriae]|uniref:MucBP domain-containing protein n=2 Tax=Listeria booriae TaxID=1552123 RepID=UPI001627E6BD
MSTNQKGRKRQVWMSIGLAGVLVTNGCLHYAVPANEVQAVETTQSERETKVTTIPAGSTFASIFPSSKLALQVAMEIYPQTHPNNIDVKKEVTQAELDRVTTIEDDPDLGDPIGNIEGVQYLRNLENLWVGTTSGFSGYIENLDVLSNLTKLKVLAVKNQAISDISGIKNLTNLTYLNLTDNKITDAGPIAGLTKLEFISLDMGNNLQSLAPFRQLTHLKKLYLSASVSDFRPLQHLPLIQDPGSTWQLWGEVKLPDAYVGEPVFMQAFDPMGEQVMFGGVTVDGKWEGMEAYDGKYATYSKAGMGKVSFGQSPPGSSGSRRFISVDFKQRVLPAKATVQPVTVRYVDDQGEVLAPEERLTGVLGEAYAAQAKTIDGYQLTKEPANRVGTFSTEAQTVTFVYTKEAVPVSQAVTVRHLDIEGKVVAPEEVLTGAIGDTYEAQAKVVSGYRLITIPANQTGTFGTEAQTVTFIYAQETAPPMVQPVTVQYVDDQGQALTQEETLTGVFGAPYQAEAKTIPGYQLTSLPSNHTGTFQAVAQTVRFVYT